MVLVYLDSGREGRPNLFDGEHLRLTFEPDRFNGQDTFANGGRGIVVGLTGSVEKSAVPAKSSGC